MIKYDDEPQPFFADERIAVILSANPLIVKFNRLGYGIQEIPIFL